jgi:hypothetical protein
MGAAMPIPTSYTEQTLIAYMRDGVLKRTAQQLQLVDAADYVDAVTEVTIALGVSDIGQATDMARLRAVARREAWRTAMQQAAGEHHSEVDGKANDRQQIYDHCATMYDQAAQEAIGLGPIPDSDGSTTAVSWGSVAVANKAVW